ncbi:MAG: GNAT family N-acetyltransferase [Candidatus Baltobacteraceae bacterium]
MLEIDSTLFGAEERYDLAFMQNIPTQKNLDAIVAVDEDGTTVAWALVDHSGSPVRLRSLSVHARHQRRGYGEELLRHIIGRYGPPIDLLVEKSNLGAVGLYRKVGFKAAGFDQQVGGRPRMLLDENPTEAK